MSPRYERRQRGGGGALLLLIAAAALVVAVLAIFTDVFSGKKAPDKDTDSPAVTQPADGEPDGTGDADNTAKDPEGDQKGGQSGNTDKPTVPTTKPAASNVITTDATPYQSGGVYIVGNAGYEMYNYVGSLAEKYQSTVNAVADSLSGVSQVYAMAIPLSSSITLPDSLLSDIPGSDQAQAGKDILAGMGQNIKTVPLHDALNAHRTEYIYFRTDHHWTARGAYYAYKAFCESAGLTCTPLDSFQSGKLDDFVGSMYRYTQSENLKKNPDYVEYFLPRYDVSAESFSTADMTDGKPLRVISTNITDESSKYLTFIQGDKPLIKMVSSCGSGKKVLLIKESYGNALAPFLLDTFSEVYVLDPRQESIQGMNIPSFVENNGIDTVLFCNYTMVPSNSKYMNALNAMIGA